MRLALECMVLAVNLVLRLRTLIDLAVELP